MIRIRMKRTLILLGAAVPWVLVAACDLVSAPPKGPEATSLIEQVCVIDSEGTTCLSCPDGEIPVEVREVIEAADSEMVGRWIQSRFNMRNDDLNPKMKNGDPTQIFRFFRMAESHGVFFQGDGFQIHYENIPCWYWDCYKPRMWQTDNSGKQRWRRKVPFAQAPVYPFVVGNFFLYIGGNTQAEELIVVDLESGKIVETFAPLDEKYGFHQSALLLAPAFYMNGYVYLKGYRESRLDPVSRKPVDETPAKTYVLKVRF